MIKKAIIGILLIFALTGVAAAATYVPAGVVDCYQMNVNGETYILDGDVTANGTAFQAAAPNVVLDGNGHTITYGINAMGFGFDTFYSSGVTVKNVNLVAGASGTVRHGITAQSGNTISVQNVTITSSPESAGMFLYHVSNVNIDHCKVNPAGTDGIYFDTANHVTVTDSDTYTINNAIGSDNTFRDNNIESVIFGNGSINNTVTNCDVASTIICRATASNNTITNCTVIKSVVLPILIEGYNNYIMDCAVSSTTYPGISIISPAYNNTIQRCNGSSSAQYGLYIGISDNNIVTDSVFSSTNHAGIYLLDANNNDILNCTASSTGDNANSVGIWLEQCSSNNTIYRANVSSAHSAGIIIIKNSNYNSILQSRIHAELDGVDIQQSSNYTTLTGSTVLSNSRFTVKTTDSCYSNFSSDNVLSSKYDSAPHNVNCIVIFGDSITQGGPLCGNALGAWTPILNTILNQDTGETWYVCNQGYGGDNTTQIKQRFESFLNLYHPDYVFIMAGTNDFGYGDTAESITNNILEMASIAESFGATPVLLAITPGIAFDEIRVPVNTNLKNSGYYFIDTYDAIDAHREDGVSTDGWNSSLYAVGPHPNDEGNVLLGKYIARNFEARTQIYYGTGMSHMINSDGIISKSRDVRTGDVKIPFTVRPNTGDVAINITAWTNNDRKWNESSETATSTQYIIGGFDANIPVQILRDGVAYNTATSNATGYIDWTYDGGYSEHTFEVIPVSSATITVTSHNFLNRASENDTNIEVQETQGYSGSSEFYANVRNTMSSRYSLAGLMILALGAAGIMKCLGFL